jgi:hypothetical protein
MLWHLKDTLTRVGVSKSSGGRFNPRGRTAAFDLCRSPSFRQCVEATAARQ